MFEFLGGVRTRLLCGDCLHAEEHFSDSLGVGGPESVQQQSLHHFAFNDLLPECILHHLVQLPLEERVGLPEAFHHHGQQHQLHVRFQEERLLDLQLDEVCDAVEDGFEETGLELHQVVEFDENVHADEVSVDQ